MARPAPTLPSAKQIQATLESVTNNIYGVCQRLRDSHRTQRLEPTESERGEPPPRRYLNVKVADRASKCGNVTDRAAGLVQIKLFVQRPANSDRIPSLSAVTVPLTSPLYYFILFISPFQEMLLHMCSALFSEYSRVTVARARRYFTHVLRYFNTVPEKKRALCVCV